MEPATFTNPALTAPITSESRAAACIHCGLPCLTTAVSKAEKKFCCAGCQTVYEIITENGLGHFYELNEQAGVSIKRPSRRDQFRFLDEPEVREKLVDFSDDKTIRVTFQIPSIHCIACVWLLENLFRLKPGVGCSTVNFPQREVAIQFEAARIPLSELVALLASLGYEPTLNLGSLDAVQARPVFRKLILQLGLAGFAFGNIMLISVSLYAGLDSLSRVQFQPLFGWVSLALTLPVVIYSASDYWRSAWTCLRQRGLTIELPIAVGLVACFAQSTWEILSQTGNGYFDSLTGLIFFLLIGRWFQQKSYERLSFDRDYKAFFPLSVVRRSSRRKKAQLSGPRRESLLTSAATSKYFEETVPLSALEVGDHLLLRHGELIPADARIISGEGVIDYSFVTGESEPVEKHAGELIQAGGQQTGGALEVQTVKPVSQGYLTSLWSHEAFTKERSDTLDTILNRFTRRFTITVSVVALGAAAWWWAHGQGAIALKAFTSVLIVACPCALALSAPFALGTAQRALGRHKIFLKNQHVIEALAKVDTIVFDKTGTLTSPGAARVEFQGAPLTDVEEGWLYSMTRHSTHPLPVRIGAEIAKQHFPEHVRSFLETPGRGMEGRVAGQEIWMGSAAWLESRSIPTSRRQRADNPAISGAKKNEPPCVDSSQDQAGSVVHVAINGKHRGCFTLATPLRPEADKLIANLSANYELALLSGDNERERERFVGLFGTGANLQFNQSPMNKLGFISDLQQSHKTVMMVGDGLNDAGALKQSDVGVAVVENIGAFSPASDVILEAQRVPTLAGSMVFSRNVVRIVWLSIGLSSVYNLVGLAIAASGKLSPVVCAVLMPLSSISVMAFACGATQWAAHCAGLSQLNLNLPPVVSGNEGIKIKNQGSRA